MADVHYLQPQTRNEDETSAQFAARIKEMIAKYVAASFFARPYVVRLRKHITPLCTPRLCIYSAAGLKSVPWDGYLKYFQPKPEFKERRKEVYTRNLLTRFNMPGGKSLMFQSCSLTLIFSPLCHFRSRLISARFLSVSP